MIDMPNWIHEEAERLGFAEQVGLNWTWNARGYNWAYIIWKMIQIDRKRRKQSQAKATKLNK